MLEQGFQGRQTLAFTDRRLSQLSNSVRLVLQELAKLIMWKRKTWELTHHLLTSVQECPWILARFLAPQWKSVRISCFKELAKGHIPVVPPLIFYMSICLIFLYIF